MDIAGGLAVLWNACQSGFHQWITSSEASPIEISKVPLRASTGAQKFQTLASTDQVYLDVACLGDSWSSGATASLHALHFA